MAEMTMPTIVETGKNNDSGWGGNAWGAGVGGFIGSLFGNGGFGGWGWGGNRAGQVGADVAIANQLEHVSDQIQQGTIADLQAAGATQLQIANSGNAQTVATMQGQGTIQQQLCCLGGSLGEKIDRAGDQTVAAINQGVVTGLQTQMATNDRLCAINGNITNQGYEGRLQTQTTAALLQQQHADLKATIIEQGCQDRETMREIAAQAVRDKLAEANAKIAQLETQGNLTAQLQNQTLYLISQLKTTTTTAAGA